MLSVVKRRHPRSRAIIARQVFLAARSPVLARLETGTLRRHTRNRGPMAASWITLVLGVDFGAQPIGRRSASKVVQDLIFRMVAENPPGEPARPRKTPS